MKKIVFFSNNGGIGKTTLVYHFAYMLAELGHKCLAVDLDPQANLTSMFLPDEELERIYQQDANRETIISGINPLDRGLGDIAAVKVHSITDNIGLLAGDLDLSLFEDKLSANWPKCIEGDEAAFRIVSSLSRIIENEAKNFGSAYCIIDAGPNFGALNRSIVIAADYVIVPMAADLFSLQGLRNLGERLKIWKTEWTERSSRNSVKDIPLPKGDMEPLGYIVLQQGNKGSRPVSSYLKWAKRIPSIFDQYVLGVPGDASKTTEEDDNCLASLKHYHSLIPMATEVRKPIFLLRPADGAIGAHYQAVARAYADFKLLTEKILMKTEMPAQSASRHPR